MSEPSPTSITFEEYQSCTHISQQWATSYDTKNWPLLSTLTTPTVHIDYTSVMGPAHLFPNMPAPAYITMMSSPSTLGHPLVATQHLLGAPTFARTGADAITGTFQIRAHHVRFSSGDGEGYAKGSGRRVLAVATGYGFIRHFYERMDGGWRLSGLGPEVIFDEGNLKGLFAWREEGEGVVTP